MRDLPATDEPDEVAAWAAADGIGDGLPLVRPTHERLERMLAATPADPDDTVAVLPPAGAVATVRAVAVNAILAGCEPRALPVVLAAVAAVGDPTLRLGTVEVGGGPYTQLVLVNGPARRAVGLDGGYDVLGGSARANATIGRALRLTIRNVGGSRPGVSDMSVHGQPAKLGLCVPEHEEVSPWTPLHVDRGYAPDQSTVTVVTIGGTMDVVTLSTRPDDLLQVIAGSYRYAGQVAALQAGEGLFLVSPDWAQHLAAGGYSKDDVRRYIHEHAVVSTRGTSAEDLAYLCNDRGIDPDTVPEGGLDLRVFAAPEDILLVVTGSDNVDHATNVPVVGRSVTVEIRT